MSAPIPGLPFGIPCTTTPPVVPLRLFAENRSRTLAAIAEGAPPSAIILMEGAVSKERDDSDHEPLFRQESWFHWLFGVKEPGFFGLINIGTKRTTLFMPRLPAEYAVWMGEIKTPEWFRTAYEVDEVRYVDELEAALAELNPEVIYRNYGKSTDSGNFAHPATLPAPAERYKVNDERLHTILSECRMVKTELELEVMRYASLVSSEAHIAVMAHTKPGMFEYQSESLFRHWCYYNGACRHVSYTCICASGGNGSVLHYGHAGAPNDRLIKDGDMCLFDMGGEYQCYASDITCSFPANGVFTPDQKLVYEAVLHAQWAVEDAMKPGVAWASMQELAYRTILTDFIAAGLLKGDLEEMMAVNLGSTFMRHGLGHLIGIDTHDAGGYPVGAPRIAKDGFRSLRLLRDLQENMVVTVEPGVYFGDMLMDEALANPDKVKFINVEYFNRFRGFGGVRLEDVVRVTAEGIENFTWTPRTVSDVEAVCRGAITSRLELTRKG